SPTLLNEFRFGHRVTTLEWPSAIHSQHAKEAFAFLRQINGYPVYIRPTLFPNHMIGATGDLGNTSPLTTYSDTLSWTKAKHSFKFGSEFRNAYSSGWASSGASSLIPTVNGGAGDA